MDPSAQQLVGSWVLAIVVTLVTACLAVWAAIAARAVRRQGVLPYRPRRPVPWRLFDLVLVMVIYLAFQGQAFLLVKAWLGPEVAPVPAIYNVEQAGSGHVVAQLLREQDIWLLLLCGLSAVVVAPIVEEFLFRVVLQGCLEATQRRWRRRMPTLRRLVPGAVGPIVLTSLLFARMHFRVSSPRWTSDF